MAFLKKSGGTPPADKKPAAKPAPKKKTGGGKPTVGIDIGSSLIKVVEAKPGKSGPQITALGICPTPDGAVADDVIMDPQGLGRAIKQLLTESGIQAKRCVSSVSGQSSVVVRIIEVPKMNDKELAETMKWEIERHVPFSASEVVMDFAPIQKPAEEAQDDQNMEVLLAVAQQDIVNRHVETLFAAGLDPVAIDVEPLAASRSVVDNSKGGESQQIIAIVNIGNDITDISVFRNGVLAFPRSLPIAGKAITRALSDALQITTDQAEQLKREQARVMMERAEQFADDAGFGPEAIDMGGGYGAPTIGISAGPQPAEEDENMSFIPGLGFTSMGGGEPETPAPAAMQEPVFDIDIDSGGSALPFDLGMDDGPAGVSAAAPSLDLSGDLGDVSDLITPSSAAATADEQPEEPVEVELPAFPDETVFDAIAPVLHDLVAEVRRSIEYFMSRYQSQPDKVVLCGGTARIPDLDQFFESQLGVPTVVANPLTSIEVFSRGVTEDYLQEVAAVFPVSIGLAIRDMIGE